MAWYDITGTVADWVMAGVAVYAAANANQWFSQRSHTKGFDKAEQLLSDIDEQYSKTKNYISELHDAFEYLKAVDERITYVDGNKAHDYQMLILNHTFDIQRIDELSENLEMIERWSLFLKDKDIINDVLKKLRDSSVSAFNASSLAKAVYMLLNILAWMNSVLHLSNSKYIIMIILRTWQKRNRNTLSSKKQNLLICFK
ncbi:hypothetical protein [Enterobacter hormaechei]|uniref:hypothetical protein n=1 Tax=Enterobacter hormaechei TaxID=158836 RepID=UPI00345BC814